MRIALDLERATKAADPRIRNVESASYGDALAEVALANSLGVESHDAAHDVFGLGGRARRRRFGHAVGLRVRRRAARCPISISTRSRATRRPARAGCSAPSPSPGRRIPVILDPLVTRSVLGVLSSAFNGESMLKGRSLFAGPRRREGRCAVRPADRRSHRRACARRVAVRRRRDPDAAQRADRRRRDAGLPAQRVHRPAFGLGNDRERDARASDRRRVSVCAPCGSSPVRRRRTRSCRRWAKRSTCSR